MHVQLEALYSLLDDDGSGSLTVHEMIDLFVRPHLFAPRPITRTNDENGTHERLTHPRAWHL